MSSYLTFSIIGGHIKNAEREISLMKEVSYYKCDNDIYRSEEREIFNENIRHGLLATYSLNASLESIVALLNKELCCRKKEFYTRTEALINKNVITDIVSYNKCIDLRKKRNNITHWEKNGYQLLGTMGYLPFMFGNKMPMKDDEKLISILTKESLKEYLDAFNKLFENILESDHIKSNIHLTDFLECIKHGELTFG